LLEIANKLINAFSGPLFGIYLLAMFSRRATSASVLTGGVVGSLVSYYVAYHTHIGFLWPSTFGLAATLVLALTMAAITSAVGNRTPAPGEHLTWYEVMRPVAGEASTWR
jgi:Na+/proline symporter